MFETGNCRINYFLFLYGFVHSVFSEIVNNSDVKIVKFIKQESGKINIIRTRYNIYNIRIALFLMHLKYLALTKFHR